MKERFLIRLKDIPPEGLNLDVEDEKIWSCPIEEFKLPYKITRALRAEVNIQRSENNCILKGRLRGVVTIPCDRCLEDAHIEIDDYFRIIEEPLKEDSWDISFVIEENGELFLDLGGLLWERFILNIPQKVLCFEDCKGLCPVCGVNLNIASCNCRSLVEDPRLAILKKVKILKG